MEDFRVNDTVDVNGQLALVRFVGETHFQDGEWIGVELEMPTGKNNGTVQGIQYFSCGDRYGMFVRPVVPRLVQRAPAPPPPPPPPQPTPTPQQQAKRMGRPESQAGVALGVGGKRLSVPSPSPIAQKGRSMTLRSPTRPASATKGNLSSPGSSVGPSTPRTQTPTIGANPRTSIGGATTSSASSTTLRPAPGSRPGSMGPPVVKTTATAKRQSISGGSGGGGGVSAPLARTTSTSSNSGSSTPIPRVGSRMSLKPGTVGSLVRKASQESGVSSRSSPDVGVGRNRTGSTTAAAAAPGASGAGVRPPGGRGGLTPAGGSASASARTSPSRAPATGGAELATAQREIEDLKSKIKVLEKKRQEDRENLKTLQRVQEERDKYEGIIQKLQQKYQPQQAELVELKKTLKEMEATVAEIEDVKAEHEAMLEMATLDREMAEEMTESFKAELDAVRAKAEELEMEVEILKEENEELSQGMSPEERNSAGWLQLEKQNSRLREALLRLREITSQTEEELRAANASLEEELNELAKYKEDYEAVQEKYIASQSAVEDLRGQLEAALGAEEMLEELTDRNMNMSEQIDEYRATVEDLESLKEIADELEINHIETEKQMQEELDYRDLIIGEQVKKIQQLEYSNEENEYTITRFRDLVVNLQSDLEDMKASQQITENEAEELTARSRSMLDINMKLQITAAKAQNKTIDLELRKMEAEEAIEHLAVVQMFLPDSFHSERDSVLALLRFKRVAFKANLLHNFVKERLAAQTGGQLSSGHEDQLMAACDMCDKLTWVAAMCDRFVNCISSCSVDQFARFQGALIELDPVERALNSWIEGLRRDELNEKQCVAELQRTMALMSHLGEIHLKSDLEGFASDLHMRVLLMQTYMESAASAVTLIRLAVQKKLPVNPEDEETAANFNKKADALVSQSRSVKVVAGKILRALDDFRQRNLSITTDKRSEFKACEEATQKLAVYTRAVGENVYALLFNDGADDNSSRKEPTWADLQNTMLTTTEKVLSMSESDMFGSVMKDLKNLTNSLTELAGVASDIDMTAEFEKAPAPWVIRAQELKSTKVVNVDVEDKLRRLKDDLLERATQIRIRDKTLEEYAVKIELLESRMRNVTKQSERIEELERQVTEGTGREKEFSEAIENLNEDLQSLEADALKWKKAAEDKRAVGETDRAGQERAVATAREVGGLKKEIAALKGAVGFFRKENARIRRVDLVDADSWLLKPLVDPKQKKMAEYEAELAKESRDVMTELCNLVLEERVVDLNKLCPNDTERMKWKPVKETPRWTCARQRERYAAVKAWKQDLLGRVERHLEVPKAKRRGGDAGEVRLPRASIKMVGLPPWGVMGKESLGSEEVVIRESEGWEELQVRLGVVEA
ncbi:dynein associated protein-domain-containing protein [Tricharina praecox]|uniref:dynein associated protein-domain-containing protein n=1 Tax=Tricharina praecox TaxID=43433 RepID=UPI00221FA968|nr:dynein associated protein-domain-containing protein [Tricharina praecox]KAI5856069.1 dynein associated protein-domain-containing protein [Tricharina praecox]